MKGRGLVLSIGVALLCATVAAQQQAPPAAQAQGQQGQGQGQGQGRRGGGPPAPTGPHIYIRAGLKSHGPGQHDYPQFLADWSKILTERNAVVNGSLHFPTAQELEGVDVMVMYKGDAGGMTPEEKTILENYLKRGGGLVSFHDTLCGPDPAYYSTILGGAKKHGEVNYTLDANVPYTVVDKTNPIMEGMTDMSIRDEAFFLMTWAQSPKIHVLATAKIDDTPSAKQAGHAGEDVPQIWTYENTLPGGKPYRAFVWMQGHEYSNFTDIRIEPMLLKGIAWAAKQPYDALLTVRTPQRGAGAGAGTRGGGGGH
jgi:type 1 glutamine amidotransferase